MLVDSGGGGWSPRVTYPVAPPPPPPPPPPDPPQVLFNRNPQAVVPANVKQLPGAPADRPLAGFIGPLTPEMEVLRSGPPKRPLEGFIGPLTPQQEVLRSGPPSILPRNLADGSQPKAHPTGGLAPDDPRTELIDQGYQVQEIDAGVKVLETQPVDIAAAKGQVQAAQTAEEQFWKDVYAGLTPQQNQELYGLAQAVDAAPESGKAAAQDKFDRTQQPLLTPEQRERQVVLERGVEDAQLHLEGQQLAKRLQDARLDGGFCGSKAQQAAAQERLSLVQADARVYVSKVRQVAANRKVQDAHRQVMTPENQKKLAPAQQDVVDAARQVSLDPGNDKAQQRLTNAGLVFDGVLTTTVSAADKQTLDRLDAAATRERQLGVLLENEAGIQHRYIEMKNAAQKRCGVFNSTEQQLLNLAKADYEVMQAKRGARELAVAAASSSDPEQTQELLQKLDGSMVELTRQSSDADINRAQFNRDVAVHNESGDPVANLLALQTTPAQGAPTTQQNTPVLGFTAPASFTATGTSASTVPLPLIPVQSTAPIKAQPLTVAPEFAPYLPATELTVADATQQLDAAKQNRTEFESQLEKVRAASHSNKRASWFEVIVGGIETIAGGIMMATGVGTGFGAALAIHGVYKISHGAYDLATDQTTDSWVSQGMQALHAPKGVANATSFVFDAGMTVGAGAVGVWSAVAKSATVGAKVFGVASGAVTVDGYVAGGRTAWAGLTDSNAHYAPFTTQALMLTGMSEQAASEVQVAVSTLAPLGGSVARIPSTKAPAFEEGFATTSDGSAQSAGTSGAAGTTTTTGQQPVAGQPATVQPATGQPATGQPATPAAASTSPTSSTGGSSFSYDFYARKAPEDVREQAATILVRDSGGDASKLADQLKGRTLVVERDESNNIVGAAVLQANWRGRFGRDSGGESVERGITALQHVNGDDGGVRTTAAAIEAAGRFLPKQQRVVWDSNTLRPELSDQVTDATASTPIIKRNAPALLEQQGPQPLSIHQALYGEDGSSLSLPQQLRNLNEIPVEERGSWPEAAQHARYTAQLPGRPVTFLGSERLGSIFHPIRSKDSWVAWINNTIHPTKWGVNAYKSLKAGGSVHESVRFYATYARLVIRDAWVQSHPQPSAAGRVVRNAWDELKSITTYYGGHARYAVRNAWDHVMAFKAYYGGHLRDAYEQSTAPVRRGAGWLNEHLNPYALPDIEASASRSFARNVGYGVRYGVGRGIGTAKRVLLRATIPQAATGNVDIVVDDNRYLRPWNVSTGNLGRHSIVIDFPLTGTRFGAWIGGPLAVRKPYIPGVEAPFVDSENGSVPLARFGAPPTDPQGPKALRFISMFRSMLADTGVAIRWGGVNDFYATTSATVKVATGALSFSGSVPAERGGQKGLSMLGAFTSWFPNVASSVFVGPVGSVNVSRQTMPMFNLDSSPISAGAKQRALLAGNHYTIGTEKGGASTGQFFLLNPSYGRVDPSAARREELWHNFNLFNWLG